jgi:chromosome segregation ATPase
MAKAYRWFKISEANAEIERLEGELTKATEAATSNGSDVAEQAESLRKENESLKTQVKDLTSAKEKAEAESAKAKTDFEAKEKNLAEEVKKQASAQALQITQAQGQPPIAAVPTATPATPAPAKSELKGLAKVQAAIRKELSASGIVDEKKLSK